MTIEYDIKEFKRLMAKFKRSINYALKYGRDQTNGVEIQYVFFYNEELKKLTYIIVGKQSRTYFTSVIPRMIYLINTDDVEMDDLFYDDKWIPSQIFSSDIYKLKKDIDNHKSTTCTMDIDDEDKSSFVLNINFKHKVLDNYNERGHLWFISNAGEEISELTEKSLKRSNSTKRDEFTNLVFSKEETVDSIFTLLHHDSCGHLALKYIDDDKTIDDNIMIFGMFIPAKPNRIEAYRITSTSADEDDLSTDRSVTASTFLWFNGFKVLIFYRYIDVFEGMRLEMTELQKEQLIQLEELQQANYEANNIPDKVDEEDPK